MEAQELHKPSARLAWTHDVTVLCQPSMLQPRRLALTILEAHMRRNPVRAGRLHTRHALNPIVHFRLVFCRLPLA